MAARNQLATLMVALASILLPGRPAVADNSNMTTVDVPVAETLPDPCTGEDVYLAGTAEVSAIVNITGTKAQLVGHAQEHLDGAGLTSGRSYLANVFVDISTEMQLDPVTMTAEATVIADGLLIGQGNLPNQFIEMQAHVTINANGSMTVTVINVRTGCR